MTTTTGAFVTESNMIEGIHRPPRKAELVAHDTFMALETVTVEDLERFVGTVQPNARLRDTTGLDVRIGSHFPEPGGVIVKQRLERILEAMEWSKPHHVHCLYEHLHPFTDGNGRSGRVLWAWCMEKKGLGYDQLGFLHSFYYQTLQSFHSEE